MKQEVYNKLILSFKAFGISMKEMKEASEVMKKISSAFSYNVRLEKKLTHRKRCRVIAFAMSKASNYENKRILWNLFLNT
jgi:hypothetical protein